MCRIREEAMTKALIRVVLAQCIIILFCIAFVVKDYAGIIQLLKINFWIFAGSILQLKSIWLEWHYENKQTSKEAEEVLKKLKKKNFDPDGYDYLSVDQHGNVSFKQSKVIGKI